MSNKLSSKSAIDLAPTLEDNIGLNLDLIDIITSKKNETIQNIRTNIGSWMTNNFFDNIRNLEIDLAIVLYLDKQRYRWQDLDNIAKIVLDGIKKNKKNHSESYLIEDDSQIVRLLLYKLKRTELKGVNTNSLTISFRIHNPNKQMILLYPQNI